MKNEQILTKENLLELGATNDVGRVCVLENYKIIVFNDGFIFLLGSSMLSEKINGKTVDDFNEIWKAVHNYA